MEKQDQSIKKEDSESWTTIRNKVHVEFSHIMWGLTIESEIKVESEKWI